MPLWYKSSMKLGLIALLSLPAAAAMPRPDLSAPGPAGWKWSHQGPVSLFLPKSAQAFRLRIESGYYLEDCAAGERVKIGGRLAELRREALEDGMIRVSACFYAPSRAEKRVNVTADAVDEAAAEDALAAIRSIRFPTK